MNNVNNRLKLANAGETSAETVPARPQACTSCSLHDNAQQEPSAAPPRMSERLNQSLKQQLS
jgi:hypothetical protein